MNYLDSLDVSASGLSAQRLRMNLISSNMANVNTTRTETGEPYKRKDAVFESIQQNRFKDIFDETAQGPDGGVSVAQIIEDVNGKTLAAASTVSKEVASGVKFTGNVEAAKAVGKAIAEQALSKNIKQVVFDRNGFLYHGRVKALADAAREAGLSF